MVDSAWDAVEGIGHHPLALYHCDLALEGVYQDTDPYLYVSKEMKIAGISKNASDINYRIANSVLRVKKVCD